MKYVRTEDGRIINVECCQEDNNKYYDYGWDDRLIILCYKEDIIKEADTIEDLIKVGDIVFYWRQSDDQEACNLMIYDADIEAIKGMPITKLLLPCNYGFKCVAVANHEFIKMSNNHHLVKKHPLILYSLLLKWNKSW